jgi:hypothetical protein
VDWSGIQTLRFGGATSLSESDAAKEWTLSSSDHRPSAARSMPSDGSMSISIVLFGVDGIRDGSATGSLDHKFARRKFTALLRSAEIGQLGA